MKPDPSAATPDAAAAAPRRPGEAAEAAEAALVRRNIMARIVNRHMERLGRWYLRVRLAIGALLVAAWLLAGPLSVLYSYSPRHILGLGLAILAVNALFARLHRATVRRFWTDAEAFRTRFHLLLFGEILFDWFALSLLVVHMGGVTSGVAHFLLVHCTITTGVLGPAETLLYAALSAVLYVLLCAHSVLRLGLDPHTAVAQGGLFLLLLGSLIGLLHLLTRLRFDAYARYEAARAKLERLDAEKTEYTLLVTHELKAPLAVIMNQAKLIRDGYTGRIEAKTREILERLIFRARNLLLSINDMLRFSNLQNCVDARDRFVEFRALGRIDRTIESLQGERRTTLRFTPGLDDRLLGVPEQFDTLITNLLSNAFKYSPPETQVEVDLSNRGGRLALRVTDRGTGIAAEELPRLFTPFHRTSHATAFCADGTGLGLSICRKICELNLASIAVESRLGEGTSFTVEWPLFSEDSMSFAHGKETRCSE